MKVITVDHDHEMRSYVAMILEASLSCEVLEFSSIPECISYLEVEPPEDLIFVLSDVEINGVSAMELLHWFKENLQSIPFIWLSEPENRNKLTTRQSLESKKASGFIPKPFKNDEFFPVIDKVFMESSSIFSGQETEESVPIAPDNLNEQSKEQEEVAADWEINKKKAHSSEVEADWDVGKKKNPSGETEADWEIGSKKSPGTETEADWEIGEKKDDVSETEADWEIGKKKGDAGEVEADWQINRVIKDPAGNTYKTFKALRLFAVDKMMADIYIKISDEKFLKIFSINDPLEKDRLQKYLDKGVNFLFIREQEFTAFTEYFLSLVVDKLKKAKAAPVEVKTLAELAAFDNIIETVKQVGITGATAEQIKDSVGSCLETIDKLKSIKSIFNNVFRSKNFISEHSLLVSYIAGKIATDTSWNSPQTLEKLSLASLLHDVSLEDNFLAKQHDMDVSTLQQLEAKFDGEILEAVKNHPLKTAQMLTSGQHLFADVESIILQHHERLGGEGYPSKMNSSVVSPLSCLFIIAEEYCLHLISGEQLDKDAFEKKFMVFDTGNYKTPLKSFFNVFSQV